MYKTIQTVASNNNTTYFDHKFWVWLGLDGWFTLRILRGWHGAWDRSYHQISMTHIWHLGWEASKVPLYFHMICPCGGHRRDELLTWGKSSQSDCPKRHWQSQRTSPTQKSPRSPPWHSIIKAVTKTCQIQGAGWDIGSLSWFLLCKKKKKFLDIYINTTLDMLEGWLTLAGKAI